MKSFPFLDKLMVQYVLYNFSYQLPEAINYLRIAYPNYYINPETVAPHVQSESPPQATILETNKPKAYQLPQKYKKKEKSKMENPIPNIQKQTESEPGI